MRWWLLCVYLLCCVYCVFACMDKELTVPRSNSPMNKEPTVPRCNPPFDKLSFAKQTTSIDPLLEKQSESYKEEGFQGNLGSLVDELSFAEQTETIHVVENAHLSPPTLKPTRLRAQPWSVHYPPTCVWLRGQLAVHWEGAKNLVRDMLYLIALP